MVKAPILACGADMKGSFSLARGRKAFFADGFGDLSAPDNFTRYEKAIENSIKVFGIKPRLIACDLHPGYFSSRFAERCTQYAVRRTLYKVQHHEAHIASAMVDNSIKGKVIGVAFDGTGFGSDGNIWGGEFFVGGFNNFKRSGHLEYIPMPGSDMAVREPWRMAASYLYRAFGNGFPRLNIDRKKWPVLKHMIDKKLNSPLTSSAGRLFDAAASLILSKHKAAFEAELPIELERMAMDSRGDSYGFDIKSRKGIYIIDPSKMIKGIVKDLSEKCGRSVIAAKFHDTIAEMVSKMCSRLRMKHRIDKVILSGGVFQNRYLTGKTVERLKKNDFKVYTHYRISTNDSGIPIGQIAIANARARCA
ncbi:MAG: hypothetical protein PHP46_05275 [Candidatus Omnitrophica bacterium]|nr:hypothetical protein [Candidatus Omnitrophota bacterium]